MKGTGFLCDPRKTTGIQRTESGDVAYYDGMIEIDLSQIRPMIAMPFHPSNTYTIEELNANLMDILDDCEKRAEVSFDGAVKLDLKSKVRNGKLYVDQGIIAAVPAVDLKISVMPQTS